MLNEHTLFFIRDAFSQQAVQNIWPEITDNFSLRNYSRKN